MLSLAKTPQQLDVLHVTCYMPSLYVIHFKSALNSGEAQKQIALSYLIIEVSATYLAEDGRRIAKLRDDATKTQQKCMDEVAQTDFVTGASIPQ